MNLPPQKNDIKKHLPEQKAEKLVKLDFAVIDDAVRRLIDGTCCLGESEEFDSIYYLFNMMNSALEQHFKIEEDIIFPMIGPSSSLRVAPDFIENMKVAHRQLKSLLQVVKQELHSQHVTAFHAVLREFSEALHKHTNLELKIPYDKILNRMDPQTLEPLRERVAHGYVD